MKRTSKLRTISQFEQLESRQMLTVVPMLLADIRVGQTGSGIFGEFTQYNGELFFAANDGSGSELWKTDGTEGGTVQVKDINPGSENSFPGAFVEFNGELYFSANDGSTGVELWKTDGTTAGTQRVADLRRGVDNASPGSLTVFNDSLVFAAITEDTGDEIWRSNGVESGTSRVADINPGRRGSAPGSLSGFFEFNDHLYFNAEGELGVELYRTDGESVELVFDADGGNDDSWPEQFTPFNGDLYFLAETQGERSNYNAFLYRVDGDTGEASVVFEKSVDLREGLIVVGDQLFFAAEDEERGMELYVSDGTTAGSRLVREIMPGESGSNPRSFFELNGRLFFAAGDTFIDGTNRVVHQLWSTDGTLFNTRQLGEAQLDPDVPFVAYNDEVYYRAYEEANGFELYRSDGTGAGTDLVVDIFPGGNNSLAFPQTVFEGELLFLADNGENGMEIWTWDGTTAEMAEIHLGVGGTTSEPALFGFTQLGNDLIFEASSPFYGEELFVIRGSEVQVERLPGDADGNNAVEFADFLILSSNFGKTDAVFDDGDFDGSGDVAFADFLILSQNFGTTLAANAVAGSAAEPPSQTAAAFSSVSNQSTSSTLLALDRVFADLDED